MFATLFILIKLINFNNFIKPISLIFLYSFLILLLIGKFYNSIKYYDYRTNYINEIKQIENYIPKNSKIYQYDLAGHLGFYSKIQVINGDGRVNSFEYARDLLNKNLSNYLIDHKICYLTNIFTQKLNGKKVIINQSGLLVTFEDVDLIKKFKNFNIYKLKKCNNS
jgi:hypothetical protein